MRCHQRAHNVVSNMAGAMSKEYMSPRLNALEVTSDRQTELAHDSRGRLMGRTRVCVFIDLCDLHTPPLLSRE